MYTKLAIMGTDIASTHIDETLSTNDVAITTVYACSRMSLLVAMWAVKRYLSLDMVAFAYNYITKCPCRMN